MELDEEELKELVEIIPVLMKLVPVVLESIEENSEKIVEPIARMARKYYLGRYLPFRAECDAKLFGEYIKHGFTRQEAMTLLINSNAALDKWMDSIKIPTGSKKKE